MKKATIVFLISVVIFSCNQNSDSTQQLQSQIDSLNKQISNAYKPGLGEFMSSIQVHHEKLWFAGLAQNWQLANFEIHEIMESVDDIREYAADRPETKSIVMLQPAIDGLNNSIQQKDIQSFKKNFQLLTTTCNNCHVSVNYSFNMIKIPETPPFSNQVFKIDSGK
jgi:hypothetical protein